MKKLLVVGLCLAAVAVAYAAEDYLIICSKDNPGIGEELVIIGKANPKWKGAIWGDKVKMLWILDHAEEYPMLALTILEYADSHPKFADWAWDHPVMAKRVLIYEAAHKRAAVFAAKHPGMAKWAKNHPVKAKAAWMAHRHKVAVKRAIKRK